MADKMPFGEGTSINKPPLFCGVNYQFWKVRMNIFIHSIENGPFVPQVKKDDVLVDIPSSEWTEAECKKVKFDWIAKNIITSALSCDEFFRVSQCSSAKEMWDILEVTHEGTNDVKTDFLNCLLELIILDKSMLYGHLDIICPFMCDFKNVPHLLC